MSNKVSVAFGVFLVLGCFAMLLWTLASAIGFASNRIEGSKRDRIEYVGNRLHIDDIDRLREVCTDYGYGITGCALQFSQAESLKRIADNLDVLSGIYMQSGGQ